MSINNHLDNLSQEEFKVKLVEFFQRHDADGLRAVEEIVEKYSDQKAEVFARLTEMYSQSDGTYATLLGGPPMGANSGSIPI